MISQPTEHLRSLRWWKIRAAVAVGLVLVLSACGLGDDSDAERTETDSQSATVMAEANAACDLFGETFNLAANTGAESDDIAVQRAALDDAAAAVAVALVGLESAGVPDDSQATYQAMLASITDLNKELNRAEGDDDLTASFFLKQPSGVAVAIEQTTAKAHELGLPGCDIDFAPSLG